MTVELCTSQFFWVLLYASCVNFTCLAIVLESMEQAPQWTGLSHQWPLLKTLGPATQGILFGPWASLVAQRLKRLPAMQETWVQSLGQEDPLEKEMATHSSTLAWKMPWMEEPARLQSMRLQRVSQDWATSNFLTNPEKAWWNCHLCKTSMSNLSCVLTWNKYTISLFLYH